MTGVQTCALPIYFVNNVNGYGDELHVIVIDQNGVFTGTAGTVLEKFAFVSKAIDAKNSDGSSNYYKNVINQQSKYIWWMDHPTGISGWGWTSAGNEFDMLGSPETATLSGGYYDVATDGDKQTSLDLLANKELVDVSLIITGGHSATVVQYAIDNVALARLDCVVFLSAPLDAVKNNAGSEATDIVSYRNNDIDRSTSYAVMDSG